MVGLSMFQTPCRQREQRGSLVYQPLGAMGSDLSIDETSGCGLHELTKFAVGVQVRIQLQAVIN